MQRNQVASRILEHAASRLIFIAFIKNKFQLVSFNINRLCYEIEKNSSFARFRIVDVFAAKNRAFDWEVVPILNWLSLLSRLTNFQ